MNNQNEPTPVAALKHSDPKALAGKELATSAGLQRQLLRLAICTAVLALCFAFPLYSWAHFALKSSLYSHVVMIPFISLYLGWSKKRELVRAESSPDRKLALLPLGIGAVAAVAYLLFARGWKLAPVDLVAWSTFSFVLLFVGLCLMCLGSAVVRILAFPLAFLILAVPFPEVLERGLETFLQHRSAEAAAVLFALAGTPYLRDGTAFQLPGFRLQVAPECSGIHSTLILLVSSLVAGHLLLRSNWKRGLLVALVLPLGIARNAFRIVVISELCLHVDPAFIDSPLHHRGGPIFFLLSLVPFLGLVIWMARSERRGVKSEMVVK